MNERWVITRVNRMVYYVSVFIGLALGAGYYFDYASTEVPAGFFFVFAGIVIFQQIVNSIIFFRDKGSPAFKYAALISYSAVYLFAMFGRVDALLGLNEDTIALYVYVLIIPVMILYIGYYDMNLIKITAAGAILACIGKIAFHIYIGNTSEDDYAEYMVLFGCIVIAAVSVYAVARITYENHNIKLKETEEAAHQAEQAREEAECIAAEMRSSITYASKIQKNLLPHDSKMASVFTDYSVIWKPRDIVGGDVYWIKQYDTGTVLCVADCTGHGTPGALLTTLVTSALEHIVWHGNCSDTADIIWQLDRRLSDVLHVKGLHDDNNKTAERRITDIADGCDIAALFVAKDKTVTFSSGNMPVFICDGKEVVHHRGQKIFVGEGRLGSKDEVESVSIPPGRGSKFYIASDGLYDQIGGERGVGYGYDDLKQIVLENHARKLSDITALLWDKYERYRGNEAQRDDFELVAFEP